MEKSPFSGFTAPKNLCRDVFAKGKESTLNVALQVVITAIIADFVMQRKKIVENEVILWWDISSEREYTKMFPQYQLSITGTKPGRKHTR